MDVFVNDQKQQVKENCMLSELINQLQFDSLKGIAIAIGDRVIPREKWDNQPLNNGDNIIVIKATQGG